MDFNRVISKHWLFGGLIVGCIVATAYFWQRAHDRQAVEGTITSNGRLEAVEIDLAAQYGGRVVQVTAHEGDEVKAGQLLVQLDTTELEAELRLAEAERLVAEQRRQAMEYQVAIAASDQAFAGRELGRSQVLSQNNNIARAKLDRDRTLWQKSRSSLQEGKAVAGQATAELAATAARIDRLRARIAENALHAPKDGRVLYRLAEPGEVLAPGGKALTLLDMNDVYMTLFLPTDQAGKLPIDAEARIVLDAMPEQPLPARVSFVSPQAQFTPKQVETFRERQKLVFRVKARVLPEYLANHADLIKPGLPGMADIRLIPDAPWPKR